jgi:hypothetical protein
MVWEIPGGFRFAGHGLNEKAFGFEGGNPFETERRSENSPPEFFEWLGVKRFPFGEIAEGSALGDSRSSFQRHMSPVSPDGVAPVRNATGRSGGERRHISRWVS